MNVDIQFMKNESISRQILPNNSHVSSPTFPHIFLLLMRFKLSKWVLTGACKLIGIFYLSYTILNGKLVN
jgi:hypothetical protein